MAINKKEISYSLLDLVLIREEGSPSESFKNMIDLAQKAETWGYTRFWLAEHHNTISIASSATALLIEKVAANTQKIRVGSGGIMLPNHSPIIVAEQFATLGIFYPGRIDLGLGRAPGTDQETAYAIRTDRMRAVHDFPSEISEIQRYLSKDNRSAKVRVPFAEGIHIPVYILGSSTDSAHLAAERGFPYAFASHFSTAHLFDALNIYNNKFKSSGFLKKPYSMAAINIIIADSDEEALKLSTSLIRMFLGIFTGEHSYLKKPVEMNQELAEIWKHPSIQQMLKYTFIGSKEKVKKQVKEFLEQTEVNELIAISNIYDHEDRLRSHQYFAEIMQELSQE